MTNPTPASHVRIVPLTRSTVEVRLEFDGSSVSIGKVATAYGRWYWQHRDGEQSSPVANSRAEAVTQLAAYHRKFKGQPVAAPGKRLPLG